MFKKVSLLIASTLAAGILVGATRATAAPLPWDWVGDFYGRRISTSCATNWSASATNTWLQWDTNQYNVRVWGQLLDTGRCDGQLAGLYARLLYMDGTSSDLKEIGTTGREAGQPVTIDRLFSPSKRVRAIELRACRYSRTSGINMCGQSRLFGNPMAM